MAVLRSGLSNHEIVLTVLRAAEGAMTAYQVLNAMPSGRQWSPPTVYRALERLIGDGLAHRVESINAFVACAKPDCCTGIAIFLICGSCRGVAEVPDRVHVEHLESVVADHGFRPERAVIELTGHCARCAGRLPRRAAADHAAGDDALAAV